MNLDHIPKGSGSSVITHYLKQIASSLGYEITRKRPFQGYDLEQEACESIRLVRSYTMVTYARLVTLYQQVAFCEAQKVPGAFVECGTWKGGAVGLMALSNLKYGTARRHIHLFDSFEGIPEPDESVDGERAVQQARSVGGGTSGRLASIEGFYDKYATGVGTLEENKHLLETIIGYDPSFLHYHKGWFQNTLPEVAPGIGDVALLRLDADWYASTKVCLEYLYDRVVSRGFVIIDDYGSYEGCRDAVNEFMKREMVGVFLNHIDSEARYWIKA